jgi:hypothetical protein
VCALLSGGGYAEKVVVPAGQLLPVPEGVSLTDAAGLPEVACTVWSTVFMTSHLSPGESFLVRKLPLSFHSCALEDLVLTTQSVYIYIYIYASCRDWDDTSQLFGQFGIHEHN